MFRVKFTVYWWNLKVCGGSIKHKHTPFASFTHLSCAVTKHVTWHIFGPQYNGGQPLGKQHFSTMTLISGSHPTCLLMQVLWFETSGGKESEAKGTAHRTNIMPSYQYRNGLLFLYSSLSVRTEETSSWENFTPSSLTEHFNLNSMKLFLMY